MTVFLSRFKVVFTLLILLKYECKQLIYNIFVVLLQPESKRDNSVAGHTRTGIFIKKTTFLGSCHASKEKIPALIFVKLRFSCAKK